MISAATLASRLPLPASRILFLAAAFAILTIVLGWWSIPIAAGIWGLTDRSVRWQALIAALAGALAWAVLLMWTASRGPVLALADRLGGVMNTPAPLLILLACAFPALLAWSSATLGEAAASAFLRARSKA